MVLSNGGCGDNCGLKGLVNYAGDDGAFIRGGDDEGC